LLDEVVISIIPLLLGAGIPLFWHRHRTASALAGNAQFSQRDRADALPGAQRNRVPMTHTLLDIAAACLLDDAGRLPLVRKRGTRAFMLPGGKREPGESPLQALQRELQEELDLRPLPPR
jgi:hypothetical protein